MRQSINLSDFDEVKIHKVSLGEGIKGFVYVSSKNVQHIFVEETLSPECCAETIAHEMYHLKYDKLSYGIGLDAQQDKPEQRAKSFATKHAKVLLALLKTMSI